ncbi:MAG TPA: ABC transporter ATP-binding protein [Haliangium sp.]|nr:ABC transporter ATP-binding protein [Haliangium sp.]
MEAVLTVRGGEKRYGDIRALAGVDMTLVRGRWVGLLGPNGAGKTTLVRAIAGRVRLDAGTITLLGTPLASAGGPGPGNAAARRARQRLGVVPQDLALYERLTAVENLAVFGKLHGVTGRHLRERVDWALQWTGLADRGAHRVASFSGGMKRRLNIACSVLHQPDVVLLDEPAVGVDPQSRQRIWDMLEELRAGGTALLLTTHHLDEAQQVCEEIVIIDHGRVIASGTLEALIAGTLGTRRAVALGLDRPPGDALADPDAPWLCDVADLHVEGRTVHCTVGDVAAALPALLGHLHEAGLAVGDVAVSRPSLHDVFLHLTGQELRE